MRKEIETRREGEREKERDRKRKRERGITDRLEGEPEMVYTHFQETFQGMRPGDQGKVFICIDGGTGPPVSKYEILRAHRF